MTIVVIWGFISELTDSNCVLLNCFMLFISTRSLADLVPCPTLLFYRFVLQSCCFWSWFTGFYWVFTECLVRVVHGLFETRLVGTRGVVGRYFCWFPLPFIVCVCVFGCVERGGPLDAIPMPFLDFAAPTTEPESFWTFFFPTTAPTFFVLDLFWLKWTETNSLRRCLAFYLGSQQPGCRGAWFPTRPSIDGVISIGLSLSVATDLWPHSVATRPPRLIDKPEPALTTSTDDLSPYFTGFHRDWLGFDRIRRVSPSPFHRVVVLFWFGSFFVLLPSWTRIFFCFTVCGFYWGDDESGNVGWGNPGHSIKRPVDPWANQGERKRKTNGTDRCQDDFPNATHTHTHTHTWEQCSSSSVIVVEPGSIKMQRWKSEPPKITRRIGPDPSICQNYKEETGKTEVLTHMTCLRRFENWSKRVSEAGTRRIKFHFFITFINWYVKVLLKIFLFQVSFILFYSVEPCSTE